MNEPHDDLPPQPNADEAPASVGDTHPPTSPRPSARDAPPKKSWPLFTVAALAFVPVIGILFGAAGLTWGLLSSRPRAIRAAFLAGGGALLNVIVLFGIGYYLGRGTGAFDQAMTAGAQKDLLTLVRELEQYHDEHDAYPPSLSALQQRPAVLRTINIYDQTAGLLTPRVYSYELARDGRSYDVFSVGPDGEAGTPDDIRPELPDSLATRARYRPGIPDER